MTNLSPAAQAVHDAAFSELPDGLCLKDALAAALRAAADQLTHRVSMLELNMWANELEGFDETAV